MDEGKNILYGIKLRKLRAMHNFTQKECINALKLKRQQDLSDLENGRKHFTQELIIVICRFFDVALNDFTNLHNLEYFAAFDSTNQLDIAAKEDLQFQIQLYRKHLLIKELALLQAKQESVRRGQKISADSHTLRDIPIYVLI
ncbi:MAG: helix-turn-helix domain-containing protein [Bacteroidia bacterium]|nr:helix-turn-helix domain-containing protein [Bacteroidia bacterium]